MASDEAGIWVWRQYFSEGMSGPEPRIGKENEVASLFLTVV